MKKTRVKFTGIRDIKGKMIFEGDVVMEDSKVYWNKERAMWGISNGAHPLGDYKFREDFVKVCENKVRKSKSKVRKR